MRKFLVVLDDSRECLNAMRFAAMRAAKSLVESRKASGTGSRDYLIYAQGILKQAEEAEAASEDENDAAEFDEADTESSEKAQ